MLRLLMFAMVLSWTPCHLAIADSTVFPVTVDHALGATTIPTKPQRIVTLGWSVQDAVFALGFLPIAMPKYDLTETGILPWNLSYLDDNKITLLADSTIDFEEIAGLHPDLILAVRSGVDSVRWKRLSQIANTVVYQSKPWMADWQEQTRIAGLALGVPDQAEELIKKTDAFLINLGNQHPILKDKTFVFGTYFSGSSGIVLYLPADPRVAALSSLGMQVPEFIAKLGHDNPGKFSVALSFEQADELKADMLIMWYGNGSRQDLEAHPLFRTIAPVKHGGYVAIDDPSLVWATSALSVLSIPYSFPRFVPQLAAAAENVVLNRSE